MLLLGAATLLNSRTLSAASIVHARTRTARMSWFGGIKGALFGTKSAAQPAIEAEAPACTFPGDVDFFEGDCSSCANPCTSHQQVPDYLKIDTESPLLGSMKPYRRHVLFQTPGKFWNNWSPKLEEAENSLAAELSAGAKAAGTQLGYRIIVTAVDTQPLKDGSSPCPWLPADHVLVLPDLVVLGPVTVDTAKQSLEEFLVQGKAPAGVSLRHLPSWAPPSAPPASSTADANAGSAATGLTACVLVCAHKLRDKRCGVAGPMIIDGLKAACEERGLQDKVTVLACSHVGGHKFAGNLIVYGPQGGHWYGRVKPCHAAAIVDTHIVAGRVIKELWRGRMEPNA